MSDSVRPHRRQPTRLPRPWDSPGKNTGVGCHFLLQCIKVKVKSLSHVWLFATPWTAAYQTPPSIGVSRQEYWSGLPLPSLIIRRSIQEWASQYCEWRCGIDSNPGMHLWIERWVESSEHVQCSLSSCHKQPRRQTYKTNGSGKRTKNCEM